MSEVIESGNVEVADSVVKFRRIVTGHDEAGKAIFIEDEVCPNRHAIKNIPEFATTELWKTSTTPVDNTEGQPIDPAAGAFVLNPPANGSVFRVVEFVPDQVWKTDPNVPDMMHRTPSLDYAYVIKGEIYALLDGQETLMKAGDVLIQRGTNHAWANRSVEPCVVLFVLIDANEV
ncbi:cupin domain-containing protein [Pseudomonas putida]|uniref:Cupin domain-containing protein n=1 Tax=Pseudomonas putida TaxID=303 RepID=A0A7V8J4M6_PSEPU|nr:cupin domain-containing protein [Pseudomonas putida]KAF0254596.1 cupin domain-containing protein [Pseudomonas putida]